MSGTSQDSSAQAGEWFGHPKGLAVLFMTEMWERFSYYGMRALLIFYLTKHFLFGDDKAYMIYGAYTSMVYLMPVIGGLMADRYLGAAKAVMFGGILIALGQFGLAIEGAPAYYTSGDDGTQTLVQDTFSLDVFYFSLALIITGVGFLKANVSTIVGSLYETSDVRRDGGFTIFYMGINLGSFFGALLAGWLGETYGWSYGFGAAGVGMLFGLFMFRRGIPDFGGRADAPNPAALKEKVFAFIDREKLIYLGALLCTVLIWKLIQFQSFVGQVLVGFDFLMVAVVVGFSIFMCPKEERDRMLVALVLIVFSVLFWALFEQAGSSLNVFADRNVDRSLFGYDIPASMFQSLNALFIVTLAPVFSWLWVKLGNRGQEPSTPVKFALAIAQVGLGFLVLAWGAGLAGEGQLTPMIFLVLIYFFHTTGELCLSPVGLSMVTKLSVPRIVGMMMGVWFLASSTALYAAALIAQMTSGDGTHGAEDITASTQSFIEVYSNVGWLAVAVGGLLLLLAPVLKKRMHGVN